MQRWGGTDLISKTNSWTNNNVDSESSGEYAGLWVIRVEEWWFELKVRLHADCCSADNSPDTTVWWIEGHSCWLQYHWYLCSLASDDQNPLAQRHSLPGVEKQNKCQVRVSSGKKWYHKNIFWKDHTKGKMKLLVHNSNSAGTRK